MIVGEDICKPVPADMKLFRKLATVHEPKFLSANIREPLRNDKKLSKLSKGGGFSGLSFNFCCQTGSK